MITITFNPETPEQGRIVAEAIGKYLGAVAPGATVAEVRETAEAPKRTRSVKVNTSARDTAASEPTPETPQPESAPASAAEGNESAAGSTPAATAETKGSSASSATSVTLETVRATLAALSQAGKAPEVKDLIGKFGAAKLTDIPTERYGELLAAAEGL